MSDHASDPDRHLKDNAWRELAESDAHLAEGLIDVMMGTPADDEVGQDGNVWERAE